MGELATENLVTITLFHSQQNQMTIC